MKLRELEGFNFADSIGNGALLTAINKNGDVNTMTVSWGQCGILWGREVATVYVRPQRYTFEFCENGEIMTLSFFGDERRDTLAFCGTKTGRDVDKFEVCSLKYDLINGAPVFSDAKVTLILKKLYAQDLKRECFTNESPLSSYKNGDFHRAYICEIIDVITK